MAFTVYPVPPSAPLSVPAGAVGSLVEIAEHTAVDVATGRSLMIVRVVQVDGAGPPPSIRLQVDVGAVTAVGTTPTALRDQPGDGPPAALATLGAVVDDVHVVEIELVSTNHTWHIQIANSDTRDHRYTWVVGDADSATYQPWLDVPAATLAFDAMAGATTPPRELSLMNYGPGPLSLDDPDDADLGSGFRLRTVTPRTVGGNRGAVAALDFTAPDGPGTQAVTHSFASNDPGAGSVAGHSSRVALTATVRPRPRWQTGDILAIRGFDLCRLDQSTGELFLVTTDVAGAVAVSVDPSTGDAVVLGAGFDLKRVDRFSGGQTPFSGVPPVTAPVGLGVEKDGVIVVLADDDGAVTRIGPGGAVLATTFLVGLGVPAGLAVAPDDDAVVIFNGLGEQAKAVGISRSTGRQSTIAGGGDLSGPLGGVVAVTVDSDGTILVLRPTMGSGGALFRIGARDGSVVPVAAGPELAQPSAVVAAADGTIIVAAGGGVFAVHPASGAPSLLTEQHVRSLALVPELPPPT
jgi:hypothetical protein